MAEDLGTWDIITIVLYFIIVIAIGLVATFKKGNRDSAQGFFLAGKSMTFLPIAGSIFATNMGAPTLVGLAGSAASTGFAPIMFEWHATYMLVLLGWIFVPIYIASATYTMPEYLKKRFGGKRLRIYYACLQLGLAVLTGISAEMYSGALFIQQLLGWRIYPSIIVILLITAVYTILGGLAAVIYTDAVQTIILIIGCTVICGICLSEVGGYEGLVNQFLPAASNETYLTQSTYANLSCGFPPDDSFHIFRGPDSAYPWTGLTFGLTLLACYYFCTNQTIVQRNLAAKNVAHSKAACIVSSYLKFLPFFMFVWPGMVSRILFPSEVGCADPDECEKICENKAGCTNIAFPLLVLRLMPVGLKGLMLAALLACMMSSLTSIFNSCSTLFVIDIWKVFRREAKENEELIVGKVFGGLMIVLSLIWMPILQNIQGSRLWDYLQSISSFLTPPWVVVFLLGMFWKRCTERGAWWGLMAGLVIGVTRMILEFSYSVPSCGSGDVDNRPPILYKIHYLNFAIILAACTFFVVVGISYMTRPREEKQLHRVTWWTRRDDKEPELSELSEIEDTEPENVSPHEEDSKCRNIWNMVCGIQTGPPKKLSAEEIAEMRRKLTNIDEDPFWSKVCDYNAVIAVALTFFIIGFYA